MAALVVSSREALAEALYDHRPIDHPDVVAACTCGWANEVFAHSAHQVHALIASGVVTTLHDAEAQAWDEGHEAGFHYAVSHEELANPYRALAGQEDEP